MTSAVNPCDTESQPSVAHWPARHICLILFDRMVAPLPSSSILRPSWSPSNSNRALNQGPSRLSRPRSRTDSAPCAGILPERAAAPCLPGQRHLGLIVVVGDPQAAAREDRLGRDPGVE